ncbi:hypothetical protein PCE81_000390 [Salmonella enterica]|nr:hypothetical protein [Salmonella enterica]
MAHWVLKQWPQLALDAISQITFQMDNKHSSYPVCIGFVKPDVTNGAKVIHIRRLKSDPGVNLLS